MTNETRAAKREHWKGVLDRWRESGLSKAAFCRENGVRPWQLQYWFQRLNEAGPDPTAAFASVHCNGGSGIRVRLPSGLTVEVEPDFDPATLVRLLAAVAPLC